MMNEEEVIRKFINIFDGDEDSWIKYYTEEEYDGDVLMFSPSRIYGLMKNEDLPNHDFKTYSIENRSLNPQHFSLINIGDGFYNVIILMQILNAFEDHLIEMSLIKKDGINALAFKFFDDYSIVFVERITNDYKLRDDGVIFMGEDKNKFVEWDDDVAVRTVYGYNKEWKTKVYKQDKILKLDKGMDDFLTL